MAGKRAPAHMAPPAPARATERIPVVGLDCAACGNDLRAALRRLLGVQAVAVNVGAQEVAVTYDPARTSVPAIRAHLEGLGIGCR